MRSFIIIAMGACLAASCAAAQNGAEKTRSWADALGAEVTQDWASPEYRAFDFWIGEGQGNWRSKPQGEFYHQKEGSWTRQRVFPILDGKALIELAWDRDKPDEASQRGFSIRYFDPARARWVMAQNWPNANNQGTAFLDQLIGKEHHGRLSVYSITQRPNAEGEIITEHRRYNFSDIRPEKGFRWDGSNTRDEGATWYTWYVVDFDYLRALDPYGAAGTPFPGVHEETICTNEPHGAFDRLQGVWEGTGTSAAGEVGAARLSAGKGLDGCGLLASLETDEGRMFMTFGYIERFDHWVSYRLDDKPGTTHTYYVSDAVGDGAVFEEAAALTIKDEFTPYLSTASFETANALRRTVWEAVSDTDVIFREETRDAASGEWRVEANYKLTRQ